ncbi:hypothetical protein RM572_06635 [Streptomyces sp. DSM 42041]|uniref:Uncharacterized protein n=1 Tax=Streptomyces hazeniae TaxID=3075538 RepID=A0ABU2NNA0_9ACTN|nr:hypothetical protein [Streptomyces sp. DSM 42041]MDT0378455.1 hypothetical protein [Streptomyces sp. DSM 42041]
MIEQREPNRRTERGRTAVLVAPARTVPADSPAALPGRPQAPGGPAALHGPETPTPLRPPTAREPLTAPGPLPAPERRTAPSQGDGRPALLLAGDPDDGADEPHIWRGID